MTAESGLLRLYLFPIAFQTPKAELRYTESVWGPSQAQLPLVSGGVTVHPLIERRAGSPGAGLLSKRKPSRNYRVKTLETLQAMIIALLVLQRSIKGPII